MCEPGIQDGLQVFRPDRFRDIIVHSRRKTAFAVSLHGIGGHRDDGRVGGAAFHFADQRGRLEPIDFRHLAVHENQWIAGSFMCGDRFLAVTGDIDPVAEFFQHPAGDLLVHGIVLGQQQAGFWRRLGFAQAVSCNQRRGVGIGRRLGRGRLVQ